MRFYQTSCVLATGHSNMSPLPVNLRRTITPYLSNKIFFRSALIMSLISTLLLPAAYSMEIEEEALVDIVNLERMVI